MGYAFFAQRKLVLTGLVNTTQLKQAQRSDEQFSLATQQANLKQQLSSIQAAQAGELATLYGQLSSESDSDGRNTINDQIKEKEAEFKQQEDEINRQVYQISIKENAIEMEVKRLDTVLTKYQKELETLEQAEASGIENATPKFSGLG